MIRDSTVQQIQAWKFTPRLLQAFEKASGKKVNYKIAPRRGGDSTAVYAATETAERELGWKSKLDINDMCRDQWAWASVSPHSLPRSLLNALI